MISADCDSVRDDLDAFADGELRGDELRYVAQHVDSCLRCTEEIEVRRSVGGLIRQSMTHWHRVPTPAGLASGVVTRIKAESSLSWRAMLNRGVEDWHWIIVGGGSVAATFISTLLCTALVLVGSTTPRADSLSALGTNLTTSPGAMYAEVSPGGAKSTGMMGMMFVQLETSAAPVGMLPDVLVRDSQEGLLVNALAQALGGGGPLVELRSMSVEDRRKAEWLLDNITRARRLEPAGGPMNTLKVHRLHLVTNTEVTAKGLRP